METSALKRDLREKIAMSRMDIPIIINDIPEKYPITLN
jgi:hypothetical protein